jgi:hypothetical protein
MKVRVWHARIRGAGIGVPTMMLALTLNTEIRGVNFISMEGPRWDGYFFRYQGVVFLVRDNVVDVTWEAFGGVASQLDVLKRVVRVTPQRRMTLKWRYSDESQEHVVYSDYDKKSRHAIAKSDKGGEV